MVPLLLAKLSDEALQRLLDGAPLPEVAREPGSYVQVIPDDQEPYRVLGEDSR